MELRTRDPRPILAYCARCRHDQPFILRTFHWRWHLVFTILTFGLWSIGALASYIGHFVWPRECDHCGFSHPQPRKSRPAAPAAGNSNPA